MNKTLPFAIGALILVACVAQSTDASEASNQAIIGGGDPAAITLQLTPAKCSVPGAFVPIGDNATPSQIALDAYCGDLFAKKDAPQGWVVMFGSSRLKDGSPEYANAKSFASLWSTANKTVPIMTGGGPGIMEAGNRGAKEAGGVSLGMSTYFKDANDKLNTFVTDGYMFSDFETRERTMLRYAKAAVIYWGGVGTAWELFMTISDVQTKRLKKIPIVLVGKDWTDAVKPYFDYMKTKGTISPEDLDLFKIVETPEETVASINAQLAPPAPPP